MGNVWIVSYYFECEKGRSRLPAFSPSVANRSIHRSMMLVRADPGLGAGVGALALRFLDQSQARAAPMMTPKNAKVRTSG